MFAMNRGAYIKKKALVLLSSRFVRNVIVMASGAAGAQIILLVFSPLVTRLYGPAAFGVFGAFNALVAIGVPVAALAYPIAIVLPHTDEEALGVARLAAYIALGICGALIILVFFAGDSLLNTLKMTVLTPYLPLAPPVIALAAFRNIGTQLLIRQGRFHYIARVAIIQALTISVLKVAMGFVHPVDASLIAIIAAGGALHVLMLCSGIGFPETGGRAAAGQKHPAHALWMLAGRYRDFPLYRAPQTMINALSHGMPVIMLTAFFGTAQAGLYVLCMRVLATLPQLVSVSVGDVFYPRISEAVRRKRKSTRLIVKTTLGLALAGSAPFALMMVFGPWIFGRVFGQEWFAAGQYARWLSVLLFFQLVHRPGVTAVPALGIQKGLMVFEIAGTLLKLAALCLGIFRFGGDVAAIALFAITGAAVYFCLLVWVLRTAWRVDKGLANA